MIAVNEPLEGDFSKLKFLTTNNPIIVTELPRIRGSELLVPLARFDSQVYWQSKHGNSNILMKEEKRSNKDNFAVSRC